MKRLLVVRSIETTHFTKRHLVHFGYVDVPDDTPVEPTETVEAVVDPGMIRRALEKVEGKK